MEQLRTILKRQFGKDTQMKRRRRLKQITAKKFSIFDEWWICIILPLTAESLFHVFI